MLTKRISNQASNVTAKAARVDDGSETRDRAKAVISPRMPCTLEKGGDIVRYSGETRRVCLNSTRKTLVHVVVVRCTRKQSCGMCSVSCHENGVNCWKPKATKVAMGISSQANEVVQARALEGSETRETAKAMMSPRMPRILSKDGDIVRYSDENRRVRLNSVHNIRLYTPGKNVLYRNIGRAVGSVGQP